MLALIGCGKKEGFDAKPKSAAKPPEPRSVVTKAGNVTKRDPVKKETLWTVKWQGAQLEFVDEKQFGGTMFTVEGTLFEDGKPVSDFRAERAEASKTDETLSLSGKVWVQSREQKATLTCDQVKYAGGLRRLEAAGEVEVENPVYRMGPFAKVFARPDLTEIATPEMFNAN